MFDHVARFRLYVFERDKKGETVGFSALPTAAVATFVYKRGNSWLFLLSVLVPYSSLSNLHEKVCYQYYHTTDHEKNPYTLLLDCV